jgi:hypothetical protein
MQVKTCKECSAQLPLSEFYAHPMMADGHLNKCKACVRSRVKKHRSENLERIKTYDRLRSKRQHRVEARLCYIRSDAGKKAHRKACIAYDEKHPDRQLARQITSNAIRDGKLKRLPCEICGLEQSEAHHVAYDLPLLVVWLCTKHHVQAHAEHRERMRSSGSEV